MTHLVESEQHALVHTIERLRFLRFSTSGRMLWHPLLSCRQGRVTLDFCLLLSAVVTHLAVSRPTLNYDHRNVVKLRSSMSRSGLRCFSHVPVSLLVLLYRQVASSLTHTFFMAFKVFGVFWPQKTDSKIIRLLVASERFPRWFMPTPVWGQVQHSCCEYLNFNAAQSVADLIYFISTRACPHVSNMSVFLFTTLLSSSS